ncbi:hypothetical protein SRABI83_00611 [Arthrobacter sp. Bi83]|uniref:hypothetical protein n=1 Tax=Arthrobacter sp. Bi83 TaxID=2822353 RepID=UPI001DFF9910|nr:hypothetical protein [Arthrobacter sp. Bi83]CAH0146836.1 hypothetical protein SRABI83_00611 [Arthrobacter sp. Bi83]
MGSSLRLLCAISLRALLLPAVIALAWLIWGAGTATASSPDTGALSSESLNSGSLLAKPLRSGPAGDAAISAVTDSAEAVIGKASGAVSTVTRTAAPVLSEVDKVVGTVNDALASVDPRLPRIPVPGVTVPVVQVPGVTIPEVPVPGVTIPEVPVPGVTIPGVQVPSVDVPTVPTPLPSEPRPVPAPHAERPAAAVPSPSIGEPKAPAASVVEAPSTTGSVSVAKNAAPASPGANFADSDSRGQTLAQLAMTSSGRPLAAVTLHARPLVHTPLAPEHAYLAATQGESGSSLSGSDGPGGQAADVTGAWRNFSRDLGARVLDAATALPSSPAFDPGSSPD